MLTTVHGFSSPQILAAYYACAWRSFFCSISDADRDPGLDYLATTYNGIDPSAFHVPTNNPATISSFSAASIPRKATHLAIEIAKRAGVRLKMAAIPQDEAYFRELVEPHIDGDRVQFLGAVEREARNELLPACARARAHDDAPGALRPDDDRGDGVRHAGARRAHGLDSGNRRRRRDRAFCATTSTMRSRRCRSLRRSTAARAARTSKPSSPSSA